MHTMIIRDGNTVEISVQGKDGPFIEGNLVSTVKTFPIPTPFKSINCFGPIDVDFIESESSSIEVFAEENLIELIDISYFGNVLEIGLKDKVNFKTRRPLKVKVLYPSLNAIELHGAGNINIFNLKTNKFEATLVGSGTINLMGTAENASLILTGSGTINSKHLNASNLVATLSGSGDINAMANVSVNARLSGSGDINIYGNPHNEQKRCTGSGKINFR